MPVPAVDASGSTITDSNGNPVYQLDANGHYLTTRYYYSPQPIIDYINAIGHYTFHQWTLSAGWSHDTRNKYFNPTHGSIQQFGVEVALPGSTAEYYPLTHSLTLEGTLFMGYGNAYGKHSDLGLPFFQNYYAGGIADVRNFRDNTLGAIDTKYLTPGCTSSNYCTQSLGGAFKSTGSLELIIPTPFVKDDSATRLSWYVDFGNVYKKFSDFSWSGQDGVRVSTGISLHWQAPVGPIVINLGRPIVKKPGDIPETLQFNFGTTF